MIAKQVTHLGTRRELLVDDALIAATTGQIQWRLHHPVAREAALITDQPWEGNKSGHFSTIVQDGDTYRLYYICMGVDIANSGKGEFATKQLHPLHMALAESKDGITWTRPDLGQFEYAGSKHNNIVFTGIGQDAKGVHGFTPFIDTNPNCKPEERYKAVGAIAEAHHGDLWGLTSPDGLHWQLSGDQPLLKQPTGRFDSQNLAFWDSVNNIYRMYFRAKEPNWQRRIKTAISPDFVHWEDGGFLEYPNAPVEELYHNQVQPYYRAPHILVGFPVRYTERKWSATVAALPELELRQLRAQVEERFGTALTEGQFMSSRDGLEFYRWPEAFLRPGPQLQQTWRYGDKYIIGGMIETPSILPGAPKELSIYASENGWHGDSATIRRFTLRVDGFVSVNAPLSGGELLTTPITFDGDALELNIASSAAGGAHIALEEPHGRPLDGYSFDDCDQIIGDRLDYRVTWHGSPDLSKLKGQRIRMRIRLADADLYSFRFA